MRLGNACRRDQSANSKIKIQNLHSKSVGIMQVCGESPDGGDSESVTVPLSSYNLKELNKYLDYNWLRQLLIFPN